MRDYPKLQYVDLIDERMLQSPTAGRRYRSLLLRCKDCQREWWRQKAEVIANVRSNLAIRCQVCVSAGRQQPGKRKHSPRTCQKCGSMRHRVEGRACAACGLPYQTEELRRYPGLGEVHPWS